MDNDDNTTTMISERTLADQRFMDTCAVAAINTAHLLTPQLTAKRAYDVAEAMLEERKKRREALV